MIEQLNTDIAGALGAGEDRLERYHAAYYSFLIPFSGASGAIVWTIVTGGVSWHISIAAGVFIFGLSLFYFIWLRSSYNRMQKALNDSHRIWHDLSPDAPGNPYTPDMHSPERIYIWFVLVMGASSASVCVLNGILSY